MCIDETGKEVDAQKIFTICIRYMIYSLLEHINKKIIGSYQLKDINIVLTHPDICNDTAKITLTKAAQKVNTIGLIGVIKMASHNDDLHNVLYI